MAASSYYTSTFVLIFVIALGAVASDQKNYSAEEDNKVLRTDFVR